MKKKTERFAIILGLIALSLISISCEGKKPKKEYIYPPIKITPEKYVSLQKPFTILKGKLIEGKVTSIAQKQKIKKYKNTEFLIYSISGQITVQISQELYPLKKGELFYIPPNTPFRILPQKKNSKIIIFIIRNFQKRDEIKIVSEKELYPIKIKMKEKKK